MVKVVVQPNKFSITRSRATRRPVQIRHTPEFLKLDNCEQVFATINTTDEAITMPNMHKLAVNMNEDDLRTPEYQIVGGFNNNCIQISLSDELLSSTEHHIEWVCLLTFTGFQFKYILNNSKKKLLFALADEDAYCYCNKSPCQECRFKCKNGFAVYAYWKNEGIFGKDISPFNNK